MPTACRTVGSEFFGCVSCVAADKLGVFNIIDLGVISRVTNRIGYYFNSDKLFHAACQSKSYHTRTAVQVEHRIRFSTENVFTHF